MIKNLVQFDARMWKHPGIGRYIRELVTAIDRQRPPYPMELLGDAECKNYFKGRLKSAVTYKHLKSPI